MSHLRVFPAASAPALPAPARFCLLTASPTPAAAPESCLPPSSCTAESGSAPGTVPTSPGSISRLQGSISRLQGRGPGCSWHRPRGARLRLPVGWELGTPAVARRSWWLLPQQCWLPGWAGGRCGITDRGGTLQDRKCGMADKEEPEQPKNTSDSPATNGLSFRGLSKSSPCLQPPGDAEMSTSFKPAVCRVRAEQELWGLADGAPLSLLAMDGVAEPGGLVLSPGDRCRRRLWAPQNFS